MCLRGGGISQPASLPGEHALVLVGWWCLFPFFHLTHCSGRPTTPLPLPPVWMCKNNEDTHTCRSCTGIGIWSGLFFQVFFFWLYFFSCYLGYWLLCAQSWRIEELKRNLFFGGRRCRIISLLTWCFCLLAYLLRCVVVF
ncbi:hypothetical protein QBC34DRAFT_406841, partial [Podospora aff. communis PSN243]